MALLFMDGFDHYASANQLRYKWDQIDGVSASLGVLVLRSAGRRGGGTAFIGSGGTNRCEVSFPARQTVIIGVALYLDELSSTLQTIGRSVLRLRDGNTTQVRLNIESDGRLRVYRGASDLLGEASGTFGTETWTYVEIKVHFDSALGSIEVRRDGASAPILQLMDVDTGTACDNLWIGANQSNGASCYFDDLYLCDNSGDINNDFLGDVRIELLRPDSIGSYNGFESSPDQVALDASYKFWRLIIHSWSTVSASAGRLGVAQLEMRDVVGGVNIVGGGTATSSFGTAANAFDGSVGTICSTISASHPEWLQYEFPDPVTIREIVIKNGSHSTYYGNHPIRFSLQASQDGENFTPIFGEITHDWEDTNDTRVFTVPPASEKESYVNLRYPGPYATDTYLSGVEAGDRQSFKINQVTDLPTSDLIVAVQLNNLSNKTDAGGASVRNFVRSGTQEHFGTHHALSTSHSYITSIHEINPATGQPWLLSEVLDMEVGLEVVA